jgi:PTH1 family peptidyl-tRNA hydrolase
MKLIIGLGNPGLRYKNTRHNIGFLVVKEISKRFRIPLGKRRYNGLLGKGAVGEEKISLFIPETYMNLSGKAALAAVRREKVKLDELLVICDDINLKLGFIRLRKKGSSGGHNGMSSVIEYLKTDAFPRLRVGIGQDREAGDVSAFVLRPFDAREKPVLKEIIGRSAECAFAWVKDGPEKAMAKFNKRQFA